MRDNTARTSPLGYASAKQLREEGVRRRIGLRRRPIEKCYLGTQDIRLGLRLRDYRCRGVIGLVPCLLERYEFCRNVLNLYGDDLTVDDQLPGRVRDQIRVILANPP